MNDKQPPALAKSLSLPRRILFATMLLGFSFLLAFAFGEVLVRLVSPQQLIVARPELWRPHDGLGYVHQPNLALKVNTGERDAMIYTDSAGLRVGPDGRKDAPVKVLLIGDSFMEALQVDHEFTTAHLLETGLRTAIGSPVVVRNAGVGGWEPNQYLIQTRRLLAQERFDAVVVSVYVGNDAVAWRRPHVPQQLPVEEVHFRLPRSLSGGEIINAFFAPTNDLLEENSHLFVLLKNRMRFLRMRVGLTGEYFPDEFRREQARHPRWSNTAAIAADIDAAVDSAGIEAIFVLVPESFQVYQAIFDNYVRSFGIDSTAVDVDQPSVRLREEFEARGLRVIDALPRFREAARAPAPLFGGVDKVGSPGTELEFAL